VFTEVDRMPRFPLRPGETEDDLLAAEVEHFAPQRFPDGLTGPEIPPEARIVAVVDAFDAMTTERAYRSPCSAGDALAELVRFAGIQFDSEVVAAFLRAFPDPTKLPVLV